MQTNAWCLGCDGLFTLQLANCFKYTVSRFMAPPPTTTPTAKAHLLFSNAHTQISYNTQNHHIDVISITRRYNGRPRDY